jgi:hypothetical protein
MTEFSGLPDAVDVAARLEGRARPASDTIRTLSIAAGIVASLLFVVLGVRYEMQMYADGSLFSYAVAVQDAWAFHCHNISGRLTAYLFAFAPAEAYIRLTGDPLGGVACYGFLFFVAQFLGLIATFVLDRSSGRILFSYACASTACLCPLVFGFPTEVWMMHALFWPALAACHFARRDARGATAIFFLMLALVFTHAGALIAGGAILATLALRGLRDPSFRRGCAVFAVAALVWAIVKLALRPDEYVAAVLVRAALHVFDLSIFEGPVMCLFFFALSGYSAALLLLRRRKPALAHVYATALIAAALALYWLRFDSALHAVNRYYLRTVLLLATPAFGMLAAAHLLAVDNDSNIAISVLPRIMAALTNDTMARAAAGALALVMLIHAVETEKFIRAWTSYKGEVRALAMGTASDPTLGSSRFVSSERIGAPLNRLAWFSTTHFLSVLLAPRLGPARLVVDPSATYFWLSCETATESLEARRAVPADSRELVRVYSCLHRRRRSTAGQAAHANARN